MSSDQRAPEWVELIKHILDNNVNNMRHILDDNANYMRHILDDNANNMRAIQEMFHENNKNVQAVTEALGALTIHTTSEGGQVGGGRTGTLKTYHHLLANNGLLAQSIITVAGSP